MIIQQELTDFSNSIIWVWTKLNNTQNGGIIPDLIKWVGSSAGDYGGRKGK
jgi:hypothetical protein